MMKNTLSVMKNPLDQIKSKLDTAGEKISSNKVFKMKHRNKRLEKLTEHQ